MKKLKIVFYDGSSVTYTMKNSVDYMAYFGRHSQCGMKSAVLQKYPKKDNKPIYLVGGNN